MDKKIIAFVLGTGGKEALLDDRCLASAFVPYITHYPRVGWNAQRPLDCWNAVVESTRSLLQNSGVGREDIACLALSGHSLGAVLVHRDGDLLRGETPIWSALRTQHEAAKICSSLSYWFSLG